MPFYLRLNRVKIVDNKEWGFWVFKRDLAKIRLTSLTTTENECLPGIDALRSNTKDHKAIKNATAEMINQILGRRQTITIDGIKDGQTLTFGDTGYVVHRSENIPQDINWTLLAMEDEQAIRNFGQTLSEVMGSSGFDDFSNSLATLVGAATNPAFTAGAVVVKFIAEVLAAFLRNKGDQMVGTLYISLHKPEHYPHGERKSDGIPDLSGNMLVDYSVFGYEQPLIKDLPTIYP